MNDVRRYRERDDVALQLGDRVRITCNSCKRPLSEIPGGFKCLNAACIAPGSIVTATPDKKMVQK